jgi:ubiquinone biosynthesis protein UbiJ
VADDIVTRLTALNHPDAADACDEIERLRAENKRLDDLLIRQNAVMSDDDIVTRLREHLVGSPIATHWQGCAAHHPLCAISAAADEIERLRQRVTDLEQQLTYWENVANARA